MQWRYNFFIITVVFINPENIPMRNMFNKFGQEGGIPVRWYPFGRFRLSKYIGCLRVKRFYKWRYFMRRVSYYSECLSHHRRLAKIEKYLMRGIESWCLCSVVDSLTTEMLKWFLFNPPSNFGLGDWSTTRIWRYRPCVFVSKRRAGMLLTKNLTNDIHRRKFVTQKLEFTKRCKLAIS